MFCTNCGKSIQEGINHCPYCGVAVTSNANTVPVNTAPVNPPSMPVPNMAPISPSVPTSNPPTPYPSAYAIPDTQPTKKSNTKKFVLIGVAILVVVAIVVGVWIMMGQDGEPSATNDMQTTNTDAGNMTEQSVEAVATKYAQACFEYDFNTAFQYFTGDPWTLVEMYTGEPVDTVQLEESHQYIKGQLEGKFGGNYVVNVEVEDVEYLSDEDVEDHYDYVREEIALVVEDDWEETYNISVQDVVADDDIDDICIVTVEIKVEGKREDSLRREVLCYKIGSGWYVSPFDLYRENIDSDFSY